MDHFTDKILFETRQHKIILVIKFIRLFLILVIPILLGLYFAFDIRIFILFIFGLILSVFIFSWIYFFWSKSYFIISNKKISIKVRNGLFSKYHMSIYYKNIRDLAYSKNNIFQYLLNFGTFFARSSAGANGDFEGKYLPNIEKIYKYVNNIYLLSEEKREILDSLDNLEKGYISESNKETLGNILKKEKKILQSIQGIKEVVLLSDKDRAYIFENEEDINHGVYESLRKKVLFAITHDSSFRDPDEVIVLKKGEKTIFPTVKFHEIKRTGVVSSSPGLKVHNYLKNKFQELSEHDATVLVGFDV